MSKPVYRTRAGRVVTDAEIQDLADEAERGYDPDVLMAGRRGRPLMGSAPARVVPVRLDPELESAVRSRALDDGTTASHIIREALRKYLDVG